MVEAISIHYLKTSNPAPPSNTIEHSQTVEKLTETSAAPTIRPALLPEMTLASSEAVVLFAYLLVVL